MTELVAALFGVIVGVLLHAVVLDAASAMREKER